MNRKQSSVTTKQRTLLRSTFTLTFAVEILNEGVCDDDDCSEGWLDLGEELAGLHIQYELYPGHKYDLTISLWPHCVKVTSAGGACWVRRWRLLQRRWCCFSVSHAFPVRVDQLRTHDVLVTVSAGAPSGSSAAPGRVCLPRVPPHLHRYFAPVWLPGDEAPPALERQVRDWLDELVDAVVPASCFDVVFDVPCVVPDVRHQEAIIAHLKERILNRKPPEEVPSAPPEPDTTETEKRKGKSSKKKKESAIKGKGSAKKKATPSYQMKLSGDELLAGLGGVTVFPAAAASPTPTGLGEAVALISCGGLPAADDNPLLTTRVGALGPLPLGALRDAGITEVYATWSLGPHVFTTSRAPVPARPGEGEGVIDLQYARALPLSRDQDTAALLGTLQDSSVQVQLRGICKIGEPVTVPQLIGHKRQDQSFPKAHPPFPSPEPSDVIIAVCSVDASSLARGDNAVVRGEYFLNPPIIDDSLHRAALCTNANDVNGIRAPALAVPAHIILEAQMTLEVSIAFVGCKPPQLTGGFSRFFCLSKDSNAIISLGLKMKEINTKLAAEDKKDQLLTGFVCCTGRAYFMFLEGPKDGEILQIWTLTEEHRERIQTFFSTAATYTTRIYPDLMTSSMPVIMVQLWAPLQALAACPAPTPLTRAVLKLSRLVSSRLHTAPAAAALPSAADLRELGLDITAP